MSTENNTKGVGVTFWRRSGSGRTHSLWVYVRPVEAHRSTYNGYVYYPWVIRELIRGGVGPMHGKADRGWTTLVNQRCPVQGPLELGPEFPVPDQATVDALVAEALLFEKNNTHDPCHSRWAVESVLLRRYEELIEGVYRLFKQKYDRYGTPKGAFIVETNSGSTPRLRAGFDDELKAREFVRVVFAHKLAQQATITSTANNHTQRIRRKKDKDYSVYNAS